MTLILFILLLTEHNLYLVSSLLLNECPLRPIDLTICESIICAAKEQSHGYAIRQGL